MAVGQRVGAIRAPAPLGEIAARARRDRAQQVDLGEEFEKVALLRRARLHEVDLVHRVKARDLEDVQDVVHVELGQVERRDRARKVVVTPDVVVPVVEQLQVVDFGIIDVEVVGPEFDHPLQELPLRERGAVNRRLLKLRLQGELTQGVNLIVGLREQRPLARNERVRFHDGISPD